MEASRENGGVFFRFWLSDQEEWPFPVDDCAGNLHEHRLGVASLLKTLEELGRDGGEGLNI